MLGVKSKVWFVLTITVGIITSLLVFKYLNSLKDINVSLSNMLVATQSIPKGTLVTKDMVRTESMPDKYIPARAVSKIDSVVGKSALVDMVAEDIILADKLTSNNDIKEMPYKIPEGKRAVTIAVNDISGVAGFIKPGHHVDLLVNYKTSDKVEDNKTLTLLKNILVLAVGPYADKSPQENNKKPSGNEILENLTMAVSSHDAQLIMLSENVGKLKVVLRPAKEEPDTSLKTIDLKYLESLVK